LNNKVRDLLFLTAAMKARLNEFDMKENDCNMRAPLPVSVGGVFGRMTVPDWAHCPRCGCVLDVIDRDEDCPECGGALDWSTYDDERFD